jgi:hypothetical protein
MPRRPYPPRRSGIPNGGAPPEVAPRADATTPLLGLVQPEVGASLSTWGNKLNNNFGILDNCLPSSGGGISGSLDVDGTLSVGSHLTVGSAGIAYTSYYPGHNIAFGWSGTVLGCWVDNNNIGTVATQQWASGAFLPSQGGGTINGGLTVNGGLNSTGNTVAASLQVQGNSDAGGQGIWYTGVGPGHYIAFGWTGSQLQAFVDGNYVGIARTQDVAEFEARIAGLEARLARLEGAGA